MGGLFQRNVLPSRPPTRHRFTGELRNSCGTQAAHKRKMISHAQRCVFVHIPKVAGQSVEHVFVGWNNLTWKKRAPLLLRPNDNPAKGPPRLAHLRAEEYVQFGYLPPEKFASYFKFSFVRNPW